MIRKYGGRTPQIAGSAYIDVAAVVIGDVSIGEDSSVWPGVVIRGDVNWIRIGARTNIQDGSCAARYARHASFDAWGQRYGGAWGDFARMHDRVALLDWDGIDHFERSEDRGGIDYRGGDAGAGSGPRCRRGVFFWGIRGNSGGR
jgi:hypothetical protein